MRTVLDLAEIGADDIELRSKILGSYRISMTASSRVDPGFFLEAMERGQSVERRPLASKPVASHPQISLPDARCPMPE